MNIPEFEARPIFEAFSIVAGAVEESESYDFYDEAEEKAQAILKEYEASCKGGASWEVGVAFQYVVGDVIEGSQWAGEEPKILGRCHAGEMCGNCRGDEA